MIRICSRTAAAAGAFVIDVNTTMLNHDSLSHPRLRSSTIVPFTVPCSRTVRDAAPGPLAGCI